MNFQTTGQMVIRRGKIQRVGRMTKIMEHHVDQFVLFASAGEAGRFRAKPRHFLWIYSGVFPLKSPSIAPAQVSNILRCYIGPFENNQWRGCRLDSKKKSRRQFFQRIFALRILWARWAAIPSLHWLLLCLPVIAMEQGFIHGHQSLRKIICIAPNKSPNLLRRLAQLTFLIWV